MKIINVKQGSPEWLTLRQEHFTASEAPAMMGVSPYKTRDQLLYEKATGYTPPVSEFQQKLFDKGHAAEASARPLAASVVGEPELFPLTGTATVFGLPLLASFDGLSDAEDIVFEHKLWNEKLVHQIEHDHLDPLYFYQLEQQLLVSDANCAILVSSDGTAANFRYLIYTSETERREALITGWTQFAADLKKAKEQHRQGKLPNPYAEAVIRNDDAFVQAEQDYLKADQALQQAKALADEARQKLVNLTDGKKTKGSCFHIYPTERKGTIKWQQAFKAMLPDVPVTELEPFKGKPSTTWTVKALH